MGASPLLEMLSMTSATNMKGSKKQLMVYLDPDTFNRLKTLSEATDRPVNKLVTRWILEHLEIEESEHGL